MCNELIGKDGNSISIDAFVKMVVLDDSPSFLLRLTKQEKHFINIEVYEVYAWYQDKKTQKWNVPCEIELYLTGYLKWDGCCHIWYGEEDSSGKQDGYLHLCGEHSWKKHNQLMSEIWKFAGENIPAWDESVAC